jgi:two-component system, chemotaxis family, chemotaxis protein CheY
MSVEFENLRILIVEDSRHMRRLLHDMLGRYGVRHRLQAGNGAEAMNILLGNNVDLILSDLCMEPMDGIELTRRVRESTLPFAKVPIIIISGHAQRRRVAAARDAGATEFLVKPISPRDLKSRITEITKFPRQFITCDAYAGPDRRRKIRKHYYGPFRRTDDLGDIEYQ